jgi:diguanylate cyclase (GGDEF)-like protein
VTQFKPKLLADISQALNADGSRLLILAKPPAQHAQIFSYGLQPHSSSPIEKNSLWQDMLKSPATSRQPLTAIPVATQPLSIDRISEQLRLAPLFTAFGAVKIESLLILPLGDDRQCLGCLTLFRSTTTVGKNLSWTDDELKLAQSLATEMYLALMQQQLEQMFRDRAYYDVLTGLPTRVLLDRWLTLALAKMPLERQVLAVILINLDRFKNINDSLGHRCGDRLLQLITSRLKHTLGTTAMIGRWSGDEFAILVPNLKNISIVSEVADKVLNCFDLPFSFEQRFQILKTDSLYIKAKMGIGIATGGGSSETVLQQADTALNQAKNNSKNSYELYTPIITDVATDRLRLENILNRAIAVADGKTFGDCKLFLHYQPQINIQTGAIIGVEALLRCQDFHSKVINPADFIPIAEETGSIIQIGEWVIRTACQQHKLWQDMGLGNLPIAVNFSVKQLHDRNLVHRITDILAETNVSPAALEVEITETIAIKDLDLTISILESLREIGVKISLDDFGTGYSSLAALKYLPLDRLKIDRSFIRELKLNSVDACIVNTIINLGHELNLSVVAEGVETLEQFKLLRSINCDAVQGFFFSRPIPATDLETMIIEGNNWHQYLAHPHN